MESEEEDQNEEEGEGDENGNQFMVGFMFGNVGKDMRLEEDYLDEASASVQTRVHSPLARVTISSLVSACAYFNLLELISGCTRAA